MLCVCRDVIRAFLATKIQRKIKTLRKMRTGSKCVENADNYEWPSITEWNKEMMEMMMIKPCYSAPNELQNYETMAFFHISSFCCIIKIKTTNIKYTVETDLLAYQLANCLPTKHHHQLLLLIGSAKIKKQTSDHFLYYTQYTGQYIYFYLLVSTCSTIHHKENVWCNGVRVKILALRWSHSAHST